MDDFEDFEDFEDYDEEGQEVTEIETDRGMVRTGTEVEIIRHNTRIRSRVTRVYGNIRNGEAGMDLEDGTWAYADQIIRIF